MARETVPGVPLRFNRDTLAFANQTVYMYPRGHAEERPGRPGEEAATFTLRCFAMCRSVEQFRKFARFDASLPPPDDARLTSLVRRVLRRAVWRAPLPTKQRVVIPGYPDLRALSKARSTILKRNVGGGWLTYLRPGNYRMFSFWWNGPAEQTRAQRTLEEVLARNDLYVAYLTNYPKLGINHAVLHLRSQSRYRSRLGAGHRCVTAVYDPNHPEAPRVITYDTQRHQFSYQKDWDFVGGNVHGVAGHMASGCSDAYRLRARKTPCRPLYFPGFWGMLLVSVSR